MASANRDELIHAAWAALKGATWAVMAAITDRTPPAGASIGHMGFLHALATLGGRAAPGQLAKQLDVTPATATQAISALESKGLITRERETGDLRAVRVVLTTKGRAVQKQWGDAILDHIREKLGKLSDADLATVAEILARVAPPIHGPPRGLISALRHDAPTKSKRATKGFRTA